MTNVAINDQVKAEIIELIEEAKNTLGSYQAVATKCNVSAATITLMKDNQYLTKGDDMWRRVAMKLGWRSKGWQTAETSTIRIGKTILQDAHKMGLFLRIAANAGAGKTTLINSYMEGDNTKTVHRIICRDWSKREFLNKLAACLGINVGSGYKSLDNILEMVIEFFATRKGRSLLIIDQANSLKPSVLSFLIHLFNECEDRLGVIMAGTEHLRTDFVRGVKYNRKGYDELDSRCGRTFIELPGNTLKDTRIICSANGINDPAIQESIFAQCKPTNKQVIEKNEKVNIRVVLDGRLIKRAIIRHHLLNALETA